MVRLYSRPSDTRPLVILYGFSLFIAAVALVFFAKDRIENVSEHKSVYQTSKKLLELGKVQSVSMPDVIFCMRNMTLNSYDKEAYDYVELEVITDYFQVCHPLFMDDTAPVSMFIFWSRNESFSSTMNNQLAF